MSKITRETENLDTQIGLAPIHQQFRGPIRTSVIYGNHFTWKRRIVQKLGQPGTKERKEFLLIIERHYQRKQLRIRSLCEEVLRHLIVPNMLLTLRQNERHA